MESDTGMAPNLTEDEEIHQDENRGLLEKEEVADPEVKRQEEGNYPAYYESVDSSGS